jgi:hypothetical protein
MADYYPLIARAVAGLEKNTGDARRTVYERARTALVAQLRSVNPPLSENDVTRERLALEESIRKVEAEAARKNWVEPAQATGTGPTRVRAPAFPRWDPPPASAAADDEPVPLRPAARAPRPQPAPAGNGEAGIPTSELGENDRYADPAFEQPLSHPSEQAPTQLRAGAPRLERPPAPNRSLLDAGLKDFRDVVAESDEHGEAPARAAKPARETFAARAPASHDYDRIEGGAHDPSAPLPDYQAPAMLEQGHDYDDPRSSSGIPRHEGAMDHGRSRRSLRDMIKIAANIMLLAALGALLGWQWPNIAKLYSSMRSPETQVASDTPAPSTKGSNKINDRLEQNGGPTGTAPVPTQSAPTLTAAPANPAAAVAQKVVLYEEDPDEPQGRRYVGSAIWRTEQVSPGPGQPAELAIRADVEIPDRKLAMTWSLRRNTDASLPASHTVEIMFRLPQDFPSGGVSNVPGILMKASEQTRGVPLAGLAVKVTNGFFLIGLSAADSDRERNVQMLKERQWFDIPVVYNNNRRAILAVEKGTPGERVFQEAFAAWRQ